jgi:hypothetical protein
MTKPCVWPAAAFLLSCAVFTGACSQSAASAGSGAAPAGAAVTQTPALRRGLKAAAADPTKLVADYLSQCGGKHPRSSECEILRSLVVADISVDLHIVERTRDQRGKEPALLALEFPDEPDIFIPGVRILGRSQPTPEIAAKVLPQLLENRYFEIQRIVAALLEAVPDAPLADLGKVWNANHSTLKAETVYDEYPGFPDSYTAMGFPKYPGAEWFSPADSDRSIGWSTKDDAATVIKWFSQALKADPMDASQTSELQGAEMIKGIDQTKTQRLEQLIPKAASGDQTAAAQLEKLQAEMEKDSQRASEMADKGLATLQPANSSIADARWFVAKKKDGRISTMVLVYPMPAVQRTVIQLAWHLADYPSAWGDR